MPYTVYVVEDHPIFYEGLRGILEREPDFALLGHAADANTARTELAEDQPDLVILDLGLPDGSGFDLIKYVRSVHPKQPILVLSGLDKSLYAFRAVRTGALGFLSKDMAASEVVEAMRTVLSGDVYMDAELTKKMIARRVGQAEEERDPLSDLTDRELDVYRLIGSGYTVQEIADQLFLSPKTIETYRANIKTKLGVSNSRELLREATMWCLEDARPQPRTAA